jgi:HD-like signal output (HDOD) protein
MRFQDATELRETEMRNVVDGWHASIAKAILESWGLPEELQHAIERQDELELEQDGDVSMTDVLLAGKLVAKGHTDGSRFPALRRVGVALKDGVNPIEQYAEELNAVRSSLSE